MLDTAELTTEDRVLQLEEIEELRRLKFQYAKALDEITNDEAPIEQAAQLFTDDAEWKCEQFGEYSGASQLRKFLDEYQTRISFAVHFVLGEIIDLNEEADTASGRWTVWQPMTKDDTAYVLAGHSYDEYRRENGQWRIQSIDLRLRFLAEHRRGWAEEQFAESWSW